MISSVPVHPLALLRRRLTWWYAATLSLILALLGVGLYSVVHLQIERQLDDSLHSASKEVEGAAQIRETEIANTHGAVVDAVEELRIPDRMLYLLDTAGVPDTPDTASHFIRDVARRAAQGKSVTMEFDIGNQHTLCVYAVRFTVASGRAFVAVAAADEIELTDRYAALIAAFGGAALAAIVLIAAGGYFLVEKATAPAERSMAYTRRFMADAAHELRTPIAVLRTKAEVALQEPRSPETYVATLLGMGHEAQRLGRVVDDLLMLARADAGQRVVAHERFFLDDVVLDAALSVRTLAQAAGVTLAVDEFEETAILGDASLVRELVIVLLDNAVKFTPEGGTVRVRVTPVPQPTLTIEDTGCGIPADQLPHVFERFYRGDASRSRSGGAGLGLSIAQWVAEVHDARLILTSEPEAGTRATVAFSPAPTPVAN
jgi:signal transduction histidine kinase